MESSGSVSGLDVVVFEADVVAVLESLQEVFVLMLDVILPRWAATPIFFLYTH